MEEQIKKLKSKAIITIILSLLAVTWQFLNYLTIKDYVPMDNFTSIEVIIIYSSYIFLAILLFSILSLSYTAFRVSMKYRSEKKKESKKESEFIQPSNDSIAE